MCLKEPSIKASLSWKRSSSWMVASHSWHILLPLHSSHRNRHGTLWQMSHSWDMPGLCERMMALNIKDLEASQFSFKDSILLSHLISAIDSNESRTAWHLASTSSRDWSVWEKETFGNSIDHSFWGPFQDPTHLTYLAFQTLLLENSTCFCDSTHLLHYYCGLALTTPHFLPHSNFHKKRAL